MTAFFGIYQKDNEPAPAALMQQAARTMQYQARDGFEIWQGGCTALGQAPGPSGKA